MARWARCIALGVRRVTCARTVASFHLSLCQHPTMKACLEKLISRYVSHFVGGS